MEWRDTTGYAQGERDRSNGPRIWSVKVAGLRISVVKGHIYYRSSWVMHCAPWFDTHEIGPDTLTAEQAQGEALRLVGDKLESLYIAWKTEAK
jgi:hypothetical protein